MRKLEFRVDKSTSLTTALVGVVLSVGPVVLMIALRPLPGFVWVLGGGFVLLMLLGTVFFVYELVQDPVQLTVGPKGICDLAYGGYASLIRWKDVRSIAYGEDRLAVTFEDGDRLTVVIPIDRFTVPPEEVRTAVRLAVREAEEAGLCPPSPDPQPWFLPRRRPVIGFDSEGTVVHPPGRRRPLHIPWDRFLSAMPCVTRTLLFVKTAPRVEVIYLNRHNDVDSVRVPADVIGERWQEIAWEMQAAFQHYRPDWEKRQLDAVRRAARRR